MRFDFCILSLSEATMEAFAIPHNVRVRIAPSPTGFFHVGTARTALFNYLFAKKYGGAFIVRIEDTDAERSEKRFEEDILSGLRWLGLSFDEGPVNSAHNQESRIKNQDYIGEYGPYRQSARMDIYARHLQKLLDEHKAYYCFCTKEELEAQKEYMRASGLAPKYSGRCSELSPAESARKQNESAPCVVRFRTEARRLSFHDMVKGKIEIDTGLIGDFVIAKNKKEPLYNFAAAVDDGLMRITHVIRGEDHISNTPKQILLQSALGCASPVYGHVPLILAPDKSKMSKRYGAVAVSEYRAQGYLPDALVNFMAFLGWNPGGEKEIFSLAELEKEFDIKKLQTANAIFNIQKLDWFNAYYIRQKSSQELAALCAPFVPSARAELLEKVVALEKERLKKLSDIKEGAGFFFALSEYPAEMLVWKKSTKEKITEGLPVTFSMLTQLSAGEFTAVRIKEALAPAVAGGRFTNGEIYWPLRVALSGKEFSPGPAEIAEVLGKEETLARIKRAITKLSA